VADDDVPKHGRATDPVCIFSDRRRVSG